MVDSEPAALRARALDVLIVLAGRAGQLVSRRKLLDLVWGGRVVEENNLSVQINALRKVLGGEIVATVPGRGYRFLAPMVPGRPGGAVLHLHAVASPAHTAPALVTNLPAVLQPLIGREADLFGLATLVDGHALVSVVGAAGQGKTRLAQALLHARRAQYPQGVCFVDLSTLSASVTVANLVGAVAAALGLPQPSGPRPVQALVATLAPLARIFHERGTG